MSQQGEKPATADDDWWHRLYDESTPDTAPAPSAGDTLDDRFHSAVDTVGEEQESAPPPPAPGSGPRVRWEPSSSGPPSHRAPWEPPAPPALTVPPQATRAGTARSGGRSAPAPQPDAGTGDAGTRNAAVGDAVVGTGTDTGPAGPSSPPPRPSSAPPQVSSAPPPPVSVPPPPSAVPPRPPEVPPQPSAPPTAGAEPAVRSAASPRPRTEYVGDRPPTYDAEPTALPVAHPQELDELVADTVLDGARYGAYTLRAASVRGDSARYRGEPRRDALLTARFGTGEGALVLVAVAGGARAVEGAHRAAVDATRWIGGAVGRSHVRLAEDIRAGRRGDLKSGLQRLTDRSLGKLRARAAELGVPPQEYTASLRCLLLSADPACRTRVFFGVGPGGLFRLRDGGWQDIEPQVPEPSAVTGEPVVGYGSQLPETPEDDRLTMDLGITTAPSPHVDAPVPPPAESFRFRASVARPGDTLLLCSTGLADPLRGEPSLAEELARRWAGNAPPGLAAYLADTQLRVKGYADDRTACAVWEA
ncbi:protein phosphatase 2C domain-containing protein [Streptomyces sp. NPDC002133]|uniref:protein phosphatase 2C domain-containing protein n=1 Tax=Streptomyces sp. NPDC002133 TaxID=3154409 RepID=UPI0033263CE0